MSNIGSIFILVKYNLDFSLGTFYIVGVSYDETVTKPKRGGRPAWVERQDDPRVLYNLLLYRSQHEWIKANGGAELIRKMIERAMRRADGK